LARQDKKFSHLLAATTRISTEKLAK